jgi:hypothetical protein
MEKLNRRDLLKGITGVLIGSALGPLRNETSATIEGSEFPAKEAIANTIEELLDGKDAQITQMFEDEHGIIACTLEFTLADGETAVFEYMRKGRHEVMEGSNSLRTNIYVTLFDNGFPFTGTNVAEYMSGEWVVDTKALEDMVK